MPEEEKAHDVDKNDPAYNIKVSDVIKRRLEFEKAKAAEALALKMNGGKKNPTSTDQPTVKHDVRPGPASTADAPPVDNRDPEEVVRRKDIIALVNAINKSFAIIEKHRIKVEKFMEAMKAALNHPQE